MGRYLRLTRHTHLAKPAAVAVKVIIGFDIFLGGRLEVLKAFDLVMPLFRQRTHRAALDTFTANTP